MHHPFGQVHCVRSGPPPPYLWRCPVRPVSRPYAVLSSGRLCLSGSQPSFRPRREIGAYSVGALQALAVSSARVRADRVLARVCGPRALRGLLSPWRFAAARVLRPPLLPLSVCARACAALACVFAASHLSVVSCVSGCSDESSLGAPPLEGGGAVPWTCCGSESAAALPGGRPLSVIGLT